MGKAWAALICATFLLAAVPRAQAQETWVFATVDRAPFSTFETAADQQPEGFSIDLMRAIGKSLNREVTFRPMESFPAMLATVEAGHVDGAIANISITADREERMDFSQPIFESGIQILMPAETGSASRIGGLLTREILTAILIAIGMLFGGGMMMWLFERNKQPYFDRPLKDAIFPSFWWALNLVVNGGFEERMPQSRPGRVFAVGLVIASLFVVSVFVATITAAATVEALHEKVDSVNDLDGRKVGTIAGSTSAAFLTRRDIAHIDFENPRAMFLAYENEKLDALVFDGPILAYYAATHAGRNTRLIDRVYRPENYGIALPDNSPIREEVDRALLRLREDGTYDALIERWFGATFRRD